MIGYVYKITSPSEKIYIGITRDLITRISKYRNLNCKNQTRLYSSIKKYGWDTHIFEVIEKIENDNIETLLKEAEIKWILELDTFAIGLNCTTGGDGNSGRIVSLETREKMRNSQLGKKQSVETIQKRIKKTIGIKRNNEFKEKLRKAHTGKILSQETKDKIRNVNLGKVLSDEHKQKISEGLKRKHEYGK